MHGSYSLSDAFRICIRISFLRRRHWHNRKNSLSLFISGAKAVFQEMQNRRETTDYFFFESFSGGLQNSSWYRSVLLLLIASTADISTVKVIIMARKLEYIKKSVYSIRFRLYNVTEYTNAEVIAIQTMQATNNTIFFLLYILVTVFYAIIIYWLFM